MDYPEIARKISERLEIKGSPVTLLKPEKKSPGCDEPSIPVPVATCYGICLSDSGFGMEVHRSGEAPDTRIQIIASAPDSSSDWHMSSFLEYMNVRYRITEINILNPDGTSLMIVIHGTK